MVKEMLKPKPRHLEALMEIARNGVHNEIRISTTELGERINISQQSASRIINEMEADRLISRKIMKDGQAIKLEKKGMILLEGLCSRLNRIFSRKRITIKGILVSGVGQGKYYIGLKGYRKQFRDKLNFMPYPGTLNLKVSNAAGKELENLPESMVIDGFSTKKRSFGSLRCSKAKIEHGSRQILAAVVKPFRTVHGQDIIEVIAPYCLREKLKLKEGSRLKLVI